MDIFIPIVICFIVFIFCSLCGLCCRKRRNEQGAILFAPPVVTTQVHHVSAGPYPVSVSPPQTNMTHSVGQPVIMQHHGTGTGFYPMPQPQTMPQPMSGYNPMGNASNPPYPISQQFPTAPGGTPAHEQNPPSYEQVVGTDAYQKQAAYNPNYST